MQEDIRVLSQVSVCTLKYHSATCRINLFRDFSFFYRLDFIHRRAHLLTHEETLNFPFYITFEMNSSQKIRKKQQK